MKTYKKCTCEIPEPKLKNSENGIYVYCENCSLEFDNQSSKQETTSNIKCSCIQYIPGDFSPNCRNCGLPPRSEFEIPKQEHCDNCGNDICCCIIRTKETLEEAAEYYSKKSSADVFQENHKKDFTAGAKWQEERMYSEEEVLEHLNHLVMMPSSKLDLYTDDDEMITMKWFEQFKIMNN